MVLDTDPAAKNAGVYAGVQLSPLTLRAPDVAVGDFSEVKGWVQGALPLAVEYAASGQNEEELVDKIEDFLRTGTRYVWVVRLVGPRRVEVYEQGKAMRIVAEGQTLTAPGVLQNAVPVEALYNREAAHEVTLANLLQRKGFASLDAVREEGKAEGLRDGRSDGLRPLERLIARKLGRALTAEEHATLLARLTTLGADAVGDAVHDHGGDALAAWLNEKR
jgi:hypothetical protein